MNFIEYSNTWAKQEVVQGRIMVGIGILLLIASIAIFRSQHALLKGALIPSGLLVLILIGYGGFILYSRPAHSKEIISVYEKSPEEAIEIERAKHINDNKAGKTLMRFVYPILALISIASLMLLSKPYHKGIAIGFAIVFLSTYIIDYGFVSRSDAFLAFLDTLK